MHENPTKSMYEEVDDSGRGERGAPFSLTTPLGIKREARSSRYS